MAHFRAEIFSLHSVHKLIVFLIGSFECISFIDLKLLNPLPLSVAYSKPDYYYSFQVTKFSALMASESPNFSK